jgi:elongation factor G
VHAIGTSPIFNPVCGGPLGGTPAIGPKTLALEAAVGPRFGYAMGGLSIEVVGGESFVERDNELGFTQAASHALRDALQHAAVAVLEPVMSFEIEAPAEFMSGIIGELNSKKADIADVGIDGELRRVVGLVPLFRMFGYASTLRSLSQGRATFSLMPAGYRGVPEAELAERGLVWS